MARGIVLLCDSASFYTIALFFCFVHCLYMWGCVCEVVSVCLRSYVWVWLFFPLWARD